MDKLGPEDSLFALLVMLLDRYAEDKDVARFVVDLAGRYDALTQIKVEYLHMPFLLKHTNVHRPWRDTLKLCLIRSSQNQLSRVICLPLATAVLVQA